MISDQFLDAIHREVKKLVEKGKETRMGAPGITNAVYMWLLADIAASLRVLSERTGTEES